MESLKRTTKIDPLYVDSLRLDGIALSETTQRYGTIGLYAYTQDALEKAGLFSNENVRFALELAMALHGNTTRTTGHYCDHILRVGTRIITSFHITDPAIVCAAFLHDAVEDHAADIAELSPQIGVSEKEIALAYVEENFGAEVAELVNWVTNPEFSPETKQAEYEAHLRSLVYHSPKARVVKLSDFIDNAAGNHYTAAAKQAKLDNKYLPMYRLHKYGLLAPDSLITGEKRIELLRQLSEGQFRAMARIALQ